MAQRFTQVLLEEASLTYGIHGRPDLGPPDPSWEPVPWETMAYLVPPIEDFDRECGLVFQRTQTDGLGYLDLAVLDLASGTRVAVGRLEGMPEGSGSLVKVIPPQFVNGFRTPREAVDSGDYWGTDDRVARGDLVDAALDRVQDAVLDELADALGPHLIRVFWLRPAIAPRRVPDPPDAVWELWRQDDAGNRHRMQGCLTEDEARALAARYEARGHKQMYWAERQDPGGSQRGQV
jgi:hypothetical protein